MADDWGGEGGHGGGGAADDETPDGSQEVRLVFSHSIGGGTVAIWTCATYMKIRIGTAYYYYKAPDINTLVSAVADLKTRLLGWSL